MKKQKKNRHPIFQPCRSITAIGWRIGVFAFALWLGACALITHSISLEMYTQMQHMTQEYLTTYTELSYVDDKKYENLPGYSDYCRIQAMFNWRPFHDMYSQSPLFPSLRDGNAIVYEEGDAMDYDLAISYCDSGKVILDSTGSYLIFPYMTAGLWQTAESREEVSGLTYINISEVDPTYYTQENASLYNFLWHNDFYKYYSGRFTGYFEGNRFVPVTVDKSAWKDDSILSMDREGRVGWFNIYQAPAPKDKDLVTIYAVDKFGPLIIGHAANDMGPVTVDGVEYARLEDVPFRWTDEINLMDAVVTAFGKYTDTSGQEIGVYVTLRAQPLIFTMKKLTGFYILSFMSVALCLWLILRKIDRHLVSPVAQMALYSTGEPQPLPKHQPPKWLESRTLQENYESMVTDYHSTKAEARQLRTALDYAQDAESKRREMISNITHELKTPLAVIHSYAEGLKDGIAADKQEHYLTVIQEEAERMDTMVLEMLDLSRLEAGKVRLAQDRFSLLGLTRSIFDRLTPMAEEKGLQIQYYIVEEFDITADEGRIGQVITNFASNAIKYTPAGGNIWIKIYRYREKTILSVENECDPLPEEALSRVWDSFYRTETSRTTKGTGLGLTIAKAIIELHGGTVSAANTQTGVVFQFTLP